MEDDANYLLKSTNEDCIKIKGSNKLTTSCRNVTLSEETVDQGRRHELRKQLKLLKLSNMKMKKQLRSTLRVRFLNRIRLEGEITQLNCLVSKLRTAVLGINDSTLVATTEKVFSNPESARFLENSNTNRTSKPEDSPIYLLPVKKVHSEFKFFCDQCDFKCKKKTPFDIHIRRHSGERPFSCEVCGKTFVAKYELKLHAAKHVDGKKYHCDECDYVTYRPDMLVHHREKHSGLKTHRCDICGFKTNERSTMISHRKTHPEADPLPCLACEKIKSSSDGDVTTLIYEKSSIPLTNCEHKTPSHTRDELQVKDSENEANKEMREVCNDPEKKGCVKGKKRLRAQKHTCESPWSCEICGRTFKKRESLTKHTRTHTGERPFRCDRCSYSAATKHTLVIHLRKHSGEKPYSCDKCSFSCTTKGYLNIHLNNHQGIKPFACQLCPYRSVDSCKLAAHKRARHGDSKTSSSGQLSFYTSTEKLEGLPYTCTLCKTEKHFAVESTYKRHLARHQRVTLLCQLCDYTTTLGKDLRQHLKTHDRGHSCGICNYRTTQTPLFIKHMLMRHPDRPFDPLLLQNSQSTTETALNEPPQQIITNSIIPATAQLYTLNPMILNIPRAPTDHNQSNPNAAITQDIVTNHGTINYQQTTLVPALNFYWGTHS